MRTKITYEAKINKAATNLVKDMLSELYDNPEAAVLREYVSNAYKANTDAKATKPVEVHLPEKKAPYLSIKDYGDGLNSTSIIAMFADFGADAGNNDYKLIDSFKNGPKTAIAVSNNIEVTSVNNGVLNKLLLKHTKNTISARFLIKDEPTTEASGTNIVIDFKDKIYSFCMWFYGYEEFMPENMLCGYSKNEVYVTNTKFESLNACRVPDTWYFNGHEYRKPTNNDSIPNIKGFLIDKAFYRITQPIYNITDYDESKSLVIPIDKRDVKVTNSHEYIDTDNEISTVRLKEAIQYASVHAQKEYAAIADDTSLQPFEKIKRLKDIGLKTDPVPLSLSNQAAPIPKELDEPAVKLSIVSDFMQKEYSISASTNKVRVDSNLDIFLIFDTELPKRPALKKFINWVIFETDDTYKPIKEMLQTNLSYNTVATTKRGYAKMVYTNNKSIANVQAAYDAFEKANVKTTDDLSDREFTYYDHWNNKYKEKMDTQWVSNRKCIIVHPNAKYRSTRAAIIELSKLRVPMPKVDYNDIEFITPKNKKEYDYLINLDPGTPTINADDIAELNSYLNHWQICPNWINVLKTAQIFRDICTDKDKYLHSDLWSKTPFANQNYIERKMCCLSQCYYFDGYSFENKDLVTKAYSKYAGYMSGYIERDEALEIIDHINSTCASEIATLNQMLSDLDPLIK